MITVLFIPRFSTKVNDKHTEHDQRHFRRSSQVCYRLDCTRSCMIGGHQLSKKPQMRGAYRGSTCGRRQSLPGRSQFHSREGTGLPPDNHRCWRNRDPHRAVDLCRNDKSRTLPCSTLPSSCTSCINPCRSTTCEFARRRRGGSRDYTAMRGRGEQQKWRRRRLVISDRSCLATR